ETSAGSGRYTLTTSAKYAKEYGGKGLDTVAGKDFEFGLDMPARTKFMAQVKKSKKSAATPPIASLGGPQGSVDLGKPNPTSVKSIPSTATGPYPLVIAGGNGGKIDLKIKPTFPKGTTKYTFDSASQTPGTATAIRMDWLGSGHADLTAEPFAHWNND